MGLRHDGLKFEPGVCRHCRRRPITRPRRLCWGCFYTPQVRPLYPPVPAAESGRLGGTNSRKWKPAWTKRKVTS